MELGDELIGYGAVTEKLVGDENGVASPIRLRFERAGTQQQEKRAKRQNESGHWTEVLSALLAGTTVSSRRGGRAVLE